MSCYAHLKYMRFFASYCMICVTAVSADDNTSLEHTLYPSRSKLSSNGGGWGDEPPPHHKSIEFHDSFDVISIFMTGFMSMSFSRIIMIFPGHSLSPSGSKFSWSHSNFRDKPHSLFIEFSFSSAVILVYYRWLMKKVAFVWYHRVKRDFLNLT